MDAERSCQAAEIKRTLTCDTLGKNVTSPRRGWYATDSTLFGPGGDRKYLNAAERGRALAAMKTLERGRSLFAQVLAWTGARVSEVLALTPHSFEIESSLVTIVTLKRRGFAVRQIPLPPKLMLLLSQHFSLTVLQADQRRSSERLWTFCRMTAWRTIKRVMAQAGVIGKQACPKGLRHAFGVAALRATVPLTLLQRWLGHARLTTTSLYLAVSGEDELHFARKMWG